MKYPYWGSYTYEQMESAVKEELRLVTHNATTRDDLLNIMRFLADKVETLNGIIVKKDEALQAMLDAHPLGMLIWNIGKCRICGTATASGMIDCCIDCADKAARNALSLTPASVAQAVEDARVGRAVEEWLDAQGWVDRVVFADTGGLHVMLNELREVIAKAREESR